MSLTFDATLYAILTQAEAWRAALTEFTHQDLALNGFFAHHAPDQLLFVGSGRSYALAQTAAATARRVIGMDAEAHAAADMWLFPRETITPDHKSLLVVLSHSGETPSVLHALDSFVDEINGEVVAITCRADSTLARRVNPALIAANDLISAPGAMLILTLGMIHSFAGQAISERFRQLPTACLQLIDARYEFARSLALTITPQQRMILLGGGVLYGTANAAALGFSAISGRPCAAARFMDVLPAVNGDPPFVIGFVSKAASDHETAVLVDLKASGTRILALTPKPLPALAADEQILLPDKLTDYERAPLYLPIVQLIANYSN